jgi:hypothetical protein
LVEGWWSGRGVIGSRPQVGSSRRRLATAAFDQAVTFLLFIHHKHIITVKLVGRWGVLRCRYWWDLGPLPPYCAHAPIFGPSPTLGCAPVWARGQRCLKLKDLVSSSGVAVALLGLPSQLRVCRTKRRVTSVSDAAGPGGAAYMASAARLKRPEPGSKFRHRPRICIDAAFENVGMGHVLLSSLN